MRCEKQPMRVVKRKLCEDTHEHYEQQNHVGIPMSILKRKLREDTHERFEKEPV